MTTKINPPATTDVEPAVPAKPPRKSALVLKLLGRAKGATLAEIMAPTGWQPHSTRAYLSRLRTKGITITREQRKSGDIAYRIAAAASTAAASADGSAAAERAAQ